jgi:hypothetical protein
MRRLALLLAVALALHAPPCRAQGDDSLVAARKLFIEAVADQDGKRFEVALDKFRRVAAVKETANVRYRIASCLDALGRPAEALAAYDAVVRSGAQDPSSADAVAASRARGAQLESSVARLTIVVSGDAAADTEVRVDDAPVDQAALASSLPLLPGSHTLRASAAGRTPFVTTVKLAAGARVTLAVTLQPVEAPSPVPGPVPSATPTPSPTPAPATADIPPAAAPSAGVPTGAWIAFGAGGVLAVGSVVSLVLRSSNLSTLSSDCTTTSSGSLSCPASKSSEVNSAHDAAALEGPLGIGLAAGAAAAVGIGVWLWLAPPGSVASALVVAPSVSPHAAAIFLSGTVD